MSSRSLALFVLMLASQPARAMPITLDVDARDAGRHILHVRQGFPVRPGPLALTYPRWIPGEHAPTGPLDEVVGLVITAAGKPLHWQRDGVDMSTVRMLVPKGVTQVEVAFDYLLTDDTGDYSSGASATEHLLLLSWNQVLLYPAGLRSDAVDIVASVELPAGWEHGTALPLAATEGGRLRFKQCSLTTLVDSPVLCGRYFRHVDLSSTGMQQTLEMACDSRAGLAIPKEQIIALQQLFLEARSLFGGTHYRRYHFLMPMSDHISHFGLEHHESSDDRVPERLWLEEPVRLDNATLLAHELVHSWNGKYRRPSGLATGDFHSAMRGELLWVYEGLTQYLGWVLAARSGLYTREQALGELADDAAMLSVQKGRQWRPLADTATEAQLLYDSRSAWGKWRRGTDFYDEGLLLWLDADVTLRRLTHGQKSLDDFCKAFHGGTGAPEVKPYTFDDVVRTLTSVAPYDWATFLHARVDSITALPPLAGISGSGWSLVYADSMSEVARAAETANERAGEWFTLGLGWNKEGLIRDVIPGSPAYEAGVGPGMKLVGVNGRHWSTDLLRDALKASQANGTIELLVDNGEFFRTAVVPWKQGLRYPQLVRGAGEDILTQILAPHVH